MQLNWIHCGYAYVFLAGREVKCQLDRLPELTKWFSEQTSMSLEKASDDLSTFLKAASSENAPIEYRRALLNVVQLVQELFNGEENISVIYRWYLFMIQCINYSYTLHNVSLPCIHNTTLLQGCLQELHAATIKYFCVIWVKVVTDWIIWGRVRP